MSRLGYFLLGTVTGVVGVGLAAWLHDEIYGSSDDDDSDEDECESPSSPHKEPDEVAEDLKASQEILTTANALFARSKKETDRRAFDALRFCGFCGVSNNDQPDSGEALAETTT